MSPIPKCDFDLALFATHLREFDFAGTKFSENAFARQAFRISGLSDILLMRAIIRMVLVDKRKLSSGERRLRQECTQPTFVALPPFNKIESIASITVALLLPSRSSRGRGM